MVGVGVSMCFIVGLAEREQNVHPSFDSPLMASVKALGAGGGAAGRQATCAHVVTFQLLYTNDATNENEYES